MRVSSRIRRASGTGLALIVAVALTGCSHVKRQELDDRLLQFRDELSTELRGEIVQGDRNLSGEITGLDGRISNLETRLSTLQRELSRLETEYNTTVERMNESLRFNVPVYFGFDEDELTADHREVLDRFSSVVREYYPECLITVEGFTDPAGSQEYNQALGLRRAEAVKTYLGTEGGLAEEQLRAVSYGEGNNRLVAGDSHGPGERGWENRRVALVIDHGGA